MEKRLDVLCNLNMTFGLNWLPFVLIIVQLVLGELAAEKEQKLREEGQPYLVNGIS